MKIKCTDTRLARYNLESAVKLGRQRAGLLGYTETFNDNGNLYVHYFWGRAYHSISDRRKIIFRENYIDLKQDRSIVYLLSECFILFAPVTYLLYAVGGFVYNYLFLHMLNIDVKLVLLCLWIIWAIKLGPMFYIRNYINNKIKNTAL